LLCKNVASLPICPSGAVNCQVSLRDLFDRAVILSHYIHNLSSEMFNEFRKRRARERWRRPPRPALHRAHDAALLISAASNGSLNVAPQHEDLLNLVLRVLRSWNDPLYHLVSEVRGMHEAPDAILSKAIEIEEQNKRLLEGMEKIVGQISPPGAPADLLSEGSGLSVGNQSSSTSLGRNETWCSFSRRLLK
uniref:Prolactin n=1 Tax=Ictidomys tridecemlineatus TaxID=43179 RepID=I3MXG6_ICTTR